MVGSSETRAGALGELPLEDVRRGGTEWQIVDSLMNFDRLIGGQHERGWQRRGPFAAIIQDPRLNAAGTPMGMHQERLWGY